MGKPTSGRVALMSIHPVYANAILAGTKRVEFRKRRLADDVSHVIVYATAPTSAVVGVFEVAGQITLSPSTIWKRFRTVAGISKAGYEAYFEGYTSATGIEVGNFWGFTNPLHLYDDLGIRRPPQSFQYVDASGLPDGVV